MTTADVPACSEGFELLKFGLFSKELMPFGEWIRLS
jgi:hypothetical protein